MEQTLAPRARTGLSTDRNRSPERYASNVVEADHGGRTVGWARAGAERLRAARIIAAGQAPVHNPLRGHCVIAASDRSIDGRPRRLSTTRYLRLTGGCTSLMEHRPCSIYAIELP